MCSVTEQKLNAKGFPAVLMQRDGDSFWGSVLGGAGVILPLVLARLWLAPRTVAKAAP